jgi:hypothetical protein
VQLTFVMNRRIEAKALHFGDITRLIRPRQHHDALPMSGCTQAQTIAERRYRKRVSSPVQCTRNTFQAMPIRIGFDHGHDLRGRSHLADALEVVAQRAQMNGGDSSTAHGPGLIETGASETRKRK